MFGLAEAGVDGAMLRHVWKENGDSLVTLLAGVGGVGEDLAGLVGAEA